MHSDSVVTYLWNALLTLGSLLLGTYLKATGDALKEHRELLARTREEIREQYVHKDELKGVVAQLNARFDRLEEKLDTLIRTTK